MTAPWALQDPAPTLPVSLFDPVWHHIAALLPERPTTHPGHPLGCHLPRIVDRLVFEPVLAALVDGSGDERVPSAGCADQTIRRRVHEWAEVGLGETLHAPVPDQYGRTIRLDREDLAVDGRITMAPCGWERAGRSPVDRAKRGLKRSTLTDGAGGPGCRGAGVPGLGTGKPTRRALLGPTLAGPRASDPVPRDAAVHLDRGYDGALTRRLLAALGLRGCVERRYTRGLDRRGPVPSRRPAIPASSPSRYPSDLSDAEWAIRAPLVPAPKPGGCPAVHPRREVVNAIRYVLRTGCHWRALPSDLPPWGTVWWSFRTWRQEGVWERVNTALRERVRVAAGQTDTPARRS